MASYKTPETPLNQKVQGSLWSVGTKECVLKPAIGWEVLEQSNLTKTLLKKVASSYSLLPYNYLKKNIQTSEI